ncbi:hypothetical protein BGZ81_004412 [Podila clonocystis]|nr:hypothetical protein BGZ81_004412 [Podila clonocystis]
MKWMVESASGGIPGLELQKANLTVSSRTFNILAADLKEAPSLYRKKSRSFKLTRMAEIAEQLASYGDKIHTAKEAWRSNEGPWCGVLDRPCGERSPSPSLAGAVSNSTTQHALDHIAFCSVPSLECISYIHYIYYRQAILAV